MEKVVNFSSLKFDQTNRTITYVSLISGPLGTKTAARAIPAATTNRHKINMQRPTQTLQYTAFLLSFSTPSYWRHVSHHWWRENSHCNPLLMNFFCWFVKLWWKVNWQVMAIHSPKEGIVVDSVANQRKQKEEKL